MIMKLNANWKSKFFTIWTGQQLSLLGSHAAQFALVWWLTTTTGSATVLATATTVALIPQIILGPLAGAYVDRWNRRLVMLIADSFIALVSLWLAYLFWSGAMQVWHVYIVMLARSLGDAFQWPAMAASTTLMVPGKHLTRIAGMNQTIKGLLIIVGSPLGALLLSLLPLHGVMLVDLGTALFAIIPLLFIAIPQPVQRGLEEKKLSIWTDLSQGFRYLRGWTGVMTLIIGALIFKIALTPAFSLIPLLVSSHFGLDATKLALLESAIGIGILVGGLGLSVWGGFRHKVHTLLMGIIGVGVGVGVAGFLPANMFFAAIPSFFFVGLMVPMTDGPIMSILQSCVAPEMQGRVFALLGSLTSLSSPLGLTMAGPVSDWLGIQVWFVIAGILCTAVGVFGFLNSAILHIEDNRYPTHQTEPAPANKAIH